MAVDCLAVRQADADDTDGDFSRTIKGKLFPMGEKEDNILPPQEDKRRVVGSVLTSTCCKAVVYTNGIEYRRARQGQQWNIKPLFEKQNFEVSAEFRPSRVGNGSSRTRSKALSRLSYLHQTDAENRHDLPFFL